MIYGKIGNSSVLRGRRFLEFVEDFLEDVDDLLATDHLLLEFEPHPELVGPLGDKVIDVIFLFLGFAF
jgi:hypothetical protein